MCVCVWCFVRLILVAGRTVLVFEVQMDLSSLTLHTSSGFVYLTHQPTYLLNTSPLVLHTHAHRKTSDLIPLCHPLPLDQVNIDIRLVDDLTVVVECECKVTHKTGVEMEAMTGASVAALTIYDMMKALTHQIRIQETRLVHKSGGKRLVDDNDTRKE